VTALDPCADACMLRGPGTLNDQRPSRHAITPSQSHQDVIPQAGETCGVAEAPAPAADAAVTPDANAPATDLQSALRLLSARLLAAKCVRCAELSAEGRRLKYCLRNDGGHVEHWHSSIICPASNCSCITVGAAQSRAQSREMHHPCKFRESAALAAGTRCQPRSRLWRSSTQLPPRRSGGSRSWRSGCRSGQTKNRRLRAAEILRWRRQRWQRLRRRRTVSGVQNRQMLTTAWWRPAAIRRMRQRRSASGGYC